MALPERKYFRLDELAEIWRCAVEDIEHCIETGQLTAWVIWDGGLHGSGNIELRELPATSLRKFKREQRFVGPQIARYDDVCVSREECSRFDNEHGITEAFASSNKAEDRQDEKHALRKSQRHRERCRAIAALIWSQAEAITIEDMTRRDEITIYGCEKEIYSTDTIRNWIKDLAPNRQPGRRPTQI